MTNKGQQWSLEPDENGRYKEEDVWAAVTVMQAERYAALHAAFGDDVDAMLMFPWTPPVPKEPGAG